MPVKIHPDRDAASRLGCFLCAARLGLIIVISLHPTDSIIVSIDILVGYFVNLDYDFIKY